MTADASAPAMRVRLRGSNVGISEATPLFPLHVSSTITSTALQVQCTANDSASGADITLYRRRGASTVGQNNDLLSTIYWRGHNDNATTEQVDYAAVEGSIVSVTNNSEFGQLAFKVQNSGTMSTRLTLQAATLTLADALNIAVNTTTGTKIGTATTQKLGFYNATPVVQPAAIADLTVTATTGTLPTATGSQVIADAAAPTNAELLKYCVELEAKLELALARLRSLGLIAT
jgi:hypothetical protein